MILIIKNYNIYLKQYEIFVILYAGLIKNSIRIYFENKYLINMDNTPSNDILKGREEGEE